MTNVKNTKQPPVLGGTITTNIEPTNKLSSLQERLLLILDGKSLRSSLRYLEIPLLRISSLGTSYHHFKRDYY